MRRYADGGAVKLREAIGRRHGLDPALVVTGHGSEDLIGLVARAYAGPGDEVLVSQYGYAMYPMAARVAGAAVVTAPARDLAADVDALLEAVTPRTRILFLANPNNPTGLCLGAAEIERLHRGLPEEVLLVLDAAYAEYVTRDDYEPGQRLAATAPNVVMLRTFSKAYGLAGLRIGWLYGPRDVVDVLNRVRPPTNISAPAQAAATAAVEDAAHVAAVVAANTATRARFVNSAAQLGLAPVPGEGNFVLVRFLSEERRATRLPPTSSSGHAAFSAGAWIPTGCPSICGSPSARTRRSRSSSKPSPTFLPEQIVRINQIKRPAFSLNRHQIYKNYSISSKLYLLLIKSIRGKRGRSSFAALNDRGLSPAAAGRSKMKVVAVASQKGGSGKTTLAGHIAVQAERVGAGPVAMIDTDPQGSLAEWWNAREAATPAFVATGIARLAEDLRRLRALNMRLLVIDTPPAIAAHDHRGRAHRRSRDRSGRPSPHDLRAAGATVELVERLGKPLVFVINGAAQRARITSEAVIALSQHGTLAPSIIHQPHRLRRQHDRRPHRHGGARRGARGRGDRPVVGLSREPSRRQPPHRDAERFIAAPRRDRAALGGA